MEIDLLSIHFARSIVYSSTMSYFAAGKHPSCIDLTASALEISAKIQGPFCVGSLVLLAVIVFPERLTLLLRGLNKVPYCKHDAVSSSTFVLFSV